MIAPRKPPQAFRLDDPGLLIEPGPDLETAAPLVAAAEPGESASAVRPSPRRGLRWSSLFWGALGALVSLAIGLAIDELVRELFARAEWLGWLGSALAALLALAVLAMAVREVLALLRLAQVHDLKEGAEAVILARDVEGARALVRRLASLYSARPETARSRRELLGHLTEVVDAPDLLAIAERVLLGPLDEAARRIVMDGARRVSVVTAVSPRALIDVLFVALESLRLVRRLSRLYGGRPGVLGLVRLLREMVAHLAATGAIALGDSLIQQVVGHGLAARLSAKLGEGVVNGALTARIGLAAIAVCRPLPFVKARPPRMADILAELTQSAPERRDG